VCFAAQSDGDYCRMEILDKTLPTDWAHDAVARATQVLEPLTEPLLATRGPAVRVRRMLAQHPYAAGATVVVLVGVAYLALRNTGDSDESAESSTPADTRPVRSAA